MAVTNATLQMRYANTMKTKLAEFKGGRLRGLATKQIGKGNDEVTFYVSNPGTTTSTINMFAAGYVGTGGSFDKPKCSIQYNYWHDKLKMKDVNSTSLTIKDQLIRSGINSLKVGEDINIANVITAGAGGLKGSTAVALSAQINAFIGAVRVAKLKGENALDSVVKVAILMNESAYEEFFSDDKTINSLYTELSGVKGGAPKDFHFCEIITLSDSVLPSGACYFVPAGSFGFAAWEDSATSESKYEMGDDSIWMMAKTSWGAVVLDANSIVKFQYKP